MIDAYFICDGKVCTNCDPTGKCRHTNDVTHAVNFKKKGNVYEEILSSRPTKIQKVVRTYPENFTNPLAALKKLLDEGFSIVHVSTFAATNILTGNEYILEKEI